MADRPGAVRFTSELGGAVLAALGLVCMSPIAAAAQGLTGVVRHAVTSEPLPGVLVSVLDLDGERVRGTLTDAAGRYSLDVPMGRYRLRAERIGLQIELTDTLDIRTLRLRDHEIRMTDRAVLIPGLVVDARVQACRLDPERAVRIQRWWQEIRTALDVSRVVQERSAMTFELERFEREWDEELRRVLATSSERTVGTRSRPFISVSAEFLDRGGFVQGEVAGQRQYYAPDADVLLSDVFLAGHCFTLVDEAERSHQVGLRFEPLREGSVSDVEGTLWVDTTTAELQGLEFRYTDVADVTDSEAGGAVLFRYLPTGAWIVSEWYIRMPRLAVRERRSGWEPELIGYVDVGGRARPTAVGGAPKPVAFGTISGEVYDSVRSTHLPDATVAILGTRYRTTTDSAGRFVLDDAPVGRHQVSFFHADTDAWGLGSTFVEVDVREGETAEVELAVPGFRQAAIGLCLGEGARAEAVLVGHLLGPERAPLEDVALELVWYPPEAADRARAQVLPARSGSAGRFVVCTLPAEVRIEVRVEIGGRWIDAFDLVLPRRQVTYREVWIRG